MSILYCNNCWFTNVGEAFIDIGATHLLKKIFPGQQIIDFSRMSSYYIKSKNKSINESFINKMVNYITTSEIDYVVLCGMFGSDDFINSQKKYTHDEFLWTLVDKGIKVIFLGLGQSKYTENETENFKNFLHEIKPELIVSRDNVVYENFYDVCPMIKGLDCAYWCINEYDPRILSQHKKYDMVTYNRSERPKDIRPKNEIVTAYHFQYSMKEKHITENMIVSDSPYDYITMYANCENVYTDLVHASIISLQYGKHIRFDRTDNRGLAIDALESLVRDESGFLYVEEDILKNQKKRIETEIISFITNKNTFC